MADTPDDPCMGKTPYTTRAEAVSALKRIQKNGGMKERSGYSQDAKIGIYPCGEHFHHAHHLAQAKSTAQPEDNGMRDETAIRPKIGDFVFPKYMPPYPKESVDVPDMLREVARLIEGGAITGTITQMESMAQDNFFIEIIIRIAPKI